MSTLIVNEFEGCGKTKLLRTQAAEVKAEMQKLREASD